MLIYAGQSNMKRVGTRVRRQVSADLPRRCSNLDRAVNYAINGIFGNMGEVCNAGSRLLIDEPIAEAFVARFVELGKTAYQAGRPARSGDQFGTTGDRRPSRAGDELHRRAARTKAPGSSLAGHSPDLPGCYVNPTLFTGVNNRMTIAQEEIFGPVAAAIQVDGIAEALKVANDSIYGLAASVWTRDLTVAHKTVRDLEAGVIWVNCFDHGDMTQPFGGYKQSGQGRDKCVESLISYTQTKSAWINLGS